MKQTVRPIDYVTKDYEGFKNMMMELIPVHAPEWTDTSQSDFGVVLIELLSYGLDILSYYQDKAFNESFIPTAKSRKSVINLCRLLGYELKPQTPAIHTIRFNKSSDFLDVPIFIPRGTRISTDPSKEEPVIFETDADLHILAGESYGEITATHGMTVTRDILGVGDGTPYQRLTLTYPDVLGDTIELLTIESGIERRWTVVTDFLSSSPNDRHYRHFVESDNRALIEVGSGLSGRVIQNGAVVQAYYRVGGGLVGNVGQGTINTFVQEPIDGIIDFTNPHLPLQLGSDPEDLESAKFNAPKFFRTNNRAVTPLDFEDMARSFPGVAKASCVESFNNLTNEVFIYVAPEGYGTPSPQLKVGLKAFLDKVRVLKTQIVIMDAEYKEFNVDIRVTASPMFVNADIETKVRLKIQEIFDTKYFSFGSSVPLSYIFKEIMMIEGVANLVINSPATDITTTPVEIPIFNYNTSSVTVTGGLNLTNLA